MICYHLLLTCTCLSSTNYQSLLLSIPFPFFAAISKNLHSPPQCWQISAKSLQLQVSICKMNHVWSGSSFVCCGSSCFFIIQSSFSYVFPMISWWFTMISLWFSHSFHVSRCLRRLRRHDILLWSAMVPLVTDEGNVPIFFWTCNGWLWIFDQQILRFNWQDTTISTDCFFLFNRILWRYWCFNFSQLFGFLYISDHLELG